MKIGNHIIMSGEVDRNTVWEFGLTDVEPSAELCTAVGTVGITNLAEHRVVLTHNGRGWETLSGHIEPGESVAEARARENLGEGGFTASDYQHFGDRKYTSSGQRPAGGREAGYPFPVSYMPFYYAEADRPLAQPTGQEVSERGEFTLDQVAGMVQDGLVKPTEYEILTRGVAAAEAHKAAANPKRVAVIGLGVHGVRSHLEPLTRIAGCQITAVADLDSSRAEAINQKYLDGQAYTTAHWQELAGDSTIDAVMIMTPDKLHMPILERAVRNGQSAFCEKPIASDRRELDDLETLLGTAAANGTIIDTCHPRDFGREFQLIKSYLTNPAIVERDFGAPADFSVGRSMRYSLRYSIPRNDLHASFGFDHLGHEVQTASFLFGDSAVRQAELLDDTKTSFHVTGMRKDGIAFEFKGSRDVEEPGVYAESLEVVSEGASLNVDMHAGVAMMAVGDYVRIRKDPAYKTDYDGRFTAINSNFIAALHGTARPLAPAAILNNNGFAIVLHQPR